MAGKEKDRTDNLMGWLITALMILLLLAAGLFVTVKVTENAAESPQLNAARFRYLDEMKSLDLEFRGYMSILAQTNSTPLDPELLSMMKDNLRAQDMQAELLASAFQPDETRLFDKYRASLLSTRNVLTVSTDPGDLAKLWPLVGELVEGQAAMQGIILRYGRNRYSGSSRDSIPGSQLGCRRRKHQWRKPVFNPSCRGCRKTIRLNPEVQRK